MSDLDLTAAVEAVARARWERTRLSEARPWADLPPTLQARVARDVSEEDIAAAAPLIERQVRERIAAEIDALSSTPLTDTGDIVSARCDALNEAARIARGVAA